MPAPPCLPLLGKMEVVVGEEMSGYVEEIGPMLHLEGTIMQRKDTKRGPPPYRFRGIVCGHYLNPVTKQAGYVISSLAEPGCCQIYPAEQLELVSLRNPDA